MIAASRLLVDKAKTYEQTSAHFAERAEHTGDKALASSAIAFTIVAIVLREVAEVLELEDELAA